MWYTYFRLSLFGPLPPGAGPHLPPRRLRKVLVPMSFWLSITGEKPNLESLPVADIVDYPLEPAEYKPFAQARLCLTPQSLVVELWAFEVRPQPQSSLRAVFLSQGRRLTFQVWSGGRWEASLEGRPAVHPLSGENLQGVYWGARASFPRRWLEAEGPLEAGSVVRGNLYKLSDSPQKPHQGSLFPADFAGGQPEGDASLGEFVVVPY